MLLTGDIGGTKTLLGLFEPAAVRPRPIAVQSFGTLDFQDLPTMIAAFLRETDPSPTPPGAITAACFGVAGPVIDQSAALTNVPWQVDARRVTSEFGFRRVSLLNDLEAMAYGVTVLGDSEVHVLQEGEPRRDGNIALIAAGTGLGQAMLHNIGGRLVPAASEGGHADFAARTEREITLVRALTARYGRVDVEHVISGRGFFNLHPIAHQKPCVGGVDLDDPNAPAVISKAALERRCPGCVETLDMFVEAYGAESGNLALRTVSTGGFFVGGGIAPKILPAMTNGTFMRAFRAKQPLDDMVATMPVKVILNDEAGLLGAAVFAAGGE